MYEDIKTSCSTKNRLQRQYRRSCRAAEHRLRVDGQAVVDGARHGRDLSNTASQPIKGFYEFIWHILWVHMGSHVDGYRP